MTNARCPRCDTPLSSDLVLGLCPRCLLDRSAKTRPAGPEVADSTDSHLPIVELQLHFPDLEITEVLGRGGMGTVYKAKQTRLDRWVALKVLPNAVSKHPEFLERFAREAKAMARLVHPNILTIHDYGNVGEHAFLVMEFVDGPTLRDLLAAGPISAKEALAIVPQICDALQFAHEQGVVHRDIKPENILLTRRGEVKMADFGLAKLVGDGKRGLTRSQHVMGTPHYMAPEQVERPLEVDHRADIYSLGVVLYELLTGELPLGHFAPPSKRVQVDVRLDEVVLRALDREPDDRYQHASDVKTDLESLGKAESRRRPRPSEDRAENEDESLSSGILGRWLLFFGCLGLLTLSPWLFPVIGSWTFGLFGDPSAEARLERAAETGELDLLVEAVRDNAALNHKDENGQTALMLAARAGQRSIVINLLLLGASHREQDSNGYTTLMHAAELGQVEIITAFKEIADVQSTDHGEFRKKAQRVAGADPRLFDQFRSVKIQLHQSNARDLAGQTELMKAAIGGHEACFTELQFISDRRARDNKGRTALTHAILNGRTSLVKSGVERQLAGDRMVSDGSWSPTAFGVDVFALTDSEGRTPLEIARQAARRNGNEEIVPVIERFLNLAIEDATTRLETTKYPWVYHERLANAYAAQGLDEKAEESLRAAMAAKTKE